MFKLILVMLATNAISERSFSDKIIKMATNRSCHSVDRSVGDGEGEDEDEA